MNYPFFTILNILIYNALSLYYLFPLFGNKSRKDNGYVLTWFFCCSYVYMVFIPGIGCIIEKSLIFMKCIVFRVWNLYMI